MLLLSTILIIYGEFEVTQHSVVLSNVSIINNNMSGIILYTTKLFLNGTLVLHNNTGIDGGGLALYRRSYLVLYENSVLNFTNNTAKQRGGAIFVDIQFGIGACFYQYSDHTYPESVKAVTMTGNKADIAGTAIYGGDIADCFLFLLIISQQVAKSITEHSIIQHRLVSQ